MPFALLLGALTGLVLGLLGGGGSILAVPLLRYGLGLEEKSAFAGALVVVGAAALAGALSHARAGAVDTRTALGFGGLGIAGSFGGAQLARLLSGPTQLTLFALTLLVVGTFMLRGGGANVPAGTRPRPGRVALAGLSAGVLTGLLGVGGGFVIVPALTLVAGLEVRRAIGTSLLVIALNSLGGIAGYALYVSFLAPAVVAFAVAAVVASIAGAALAGRVPAAFLRRGFAVGLVVVGITMLVRELFPRA